MDPHGAPDNWEPLWKQRAVALYGNRRWRIMGRIMRLVLRRYTDLCVQFISSEFCCWQIMTCFGMRAMMQQVARLGCCELHIWEFCCVICAGTADAALGNKTRRKAMTLLLCNIQLFYMVKFAVVQYPLIMTLQLDILFKYIETFYAKSSHFTFESFFKVKRKLTLFTVLIYLEWFISAYYYYRLSSDLHLAILTSFHRIVI